MTSVICLVYFILLIGGISAIIQPRIVGGQNANIKDFPYTVSLRFRGWHFCGGSIIGPKHILTAAHCITNNRYFIHPYAELTVNTGTSTTIDPGHTHRIVKSTVHPGWRGTFDTSFTNDIAILTLADNIRFNQNQLMVRLASHDVITGKKSVLTGWGPTSRTSSTVSIQLQGLYMKLLNNTDCQSIQTLRVLKNQFCAYTTTGDGPSHGDSGGPLISNGEIIGIFSLIVTNQFGGYQVPDIFTNVFAHRNFIISTMQN